jgi:hypothetical protein
VLFEPDATAGQPYQNKYSEAEKHIGQYRVNPSVANLIVAGCVWIGPIGDRPNTLANRLLGGMCRLPELILKGGV